MLGNRNAAVRASFSRRGAIVSSGTVSWSLGLRGYGYGARLRPVRPAQPTARANRVVYRRGGVAEWYAGGPAGVEQGFTLTRRPSGSRAGPLTLSIGRLPHGVTARVGADHRGLVLAAGGRDLLRYGNLFASDAHGRSLPARVELSGGSLRLLIDDRGAQYPLRVDPLVDVAKLTASGGGLGDQLGFSVAVSGDGSTAVAGAPAAMVDGNANRGLVYVFTKPGGNWADIAQTATLDAFGGAANDGLGSSVAISADGSKVVAGAPHSLSGSGSAYVFARPAGGWSGATEQLATLTASDAAANDLFGSSIAISGDGSTVAAGAPEATIGANSAQGAAYVFVQPGGGWGSGAQPQHQTAKLTASDGAANDGLGGDNGGNAIAVSNDGSTVAAGAATATTTIECFPPDPCTMFGPGAVYVFARPGGGWSNGTQTAKLTSSDGHGNDRFGDAVAMSGDGSTIVAGAQLAVGSTGNSQQGAVYVFARPGGGWSTGTETGQADRPRRPRDRQARSFGRGLERRVDDRRRRLLRDRRLQRLPGQGLPVHAARRRLGDRHRSGRADRGGRRPQRRAGVLGCDRERRIDDPRRRKVRIARSVPPGGRVRVRLGAVIPGRTLAAATSGRSQWRRPWRWWDSRPRVGLPAEVSGRAKRAKRPGGPRIRYEGDLHSRSAGQRRASRCSSLDTGKASTASTSSR